MATNVNDYEFPSYRGKVSTGFDEILNGYFTVRLARSARLSLSARLCCGLSVHLSVSPFVGLFVLFFQFAFFQLVSK